jgi:uncharacterized membrane protein
MKSYYHKIGIFILILFSILPFVVLGLYYSNLPQEIPIFVDLFGKPIKFSNKNVFTVFRLPLMSLLLQLIILIFHLNIISFTKKIASIEVSKSIINKSEKMLFFISIIISFKLGFSLFEFLLRHNHNLQTANIVRYVTLLIVIIGICIVLKNYILIDKSIKKHIIDKSVLSIFATSSKRYIQPIIIILVIYVIVALFPFLI